MDLVAEMLLKHLQIGHADSCEVQRMCPPMRRRFTKRKSEVTSQRSANGERMARAYSQSGRRFNADRFVNRFWDYPRVVRRARNEFDLFHLVDHSYAQLLHQLPPERTVVTCHDTDTFHSLLNPQQEPRSIFFRKMMERTLSGFRKAAFVTCDSVATRDELLTHALVPAERTVIIPNGVHPTCSPGPNPVADAEAERLLGRRQKAEGRGQNAENGGTDILHVGSTIPRKRIDVLLRVFAKVKELFPKARLLRVGGAFTAEQLALVEKLNLRESIVVLPHIDREVLAAVYRRAALVLQPSEREGFGLPVVEAMACGTPVVASDLPVLREVGGDVAVYCAMGNFEVWTETIARLFTERDEQPERWEQRREAGLAQAAKFTWAEYARKMVGVYEEVLGNQ